MPSKNYASETKFPRKLANKNEVLVDERFYLFLEMARQVYEE